ncbi:MAG: hypothetical protein HZA54_14545 [Planctomycetes bacterium]|nr:hypothetical protein [Planctomycetota bacterium]
MSKYRVRVDPQTGRGSVTRQADPAPRRGRGARPGGGAGRGAGAGGGGSFAAAIRRLPEDRRERLARLAALASVLRFGAGAFVERMRVIGLGGFFGLAIGIPFVTLIAREVLERGGPRNGLLRFGSATQEMLAILAAGALVAVLVRAWWRRG